MKRFFAMLLCLCVVLSLLPSVTFAEAEETPQTVETTQTMTDEEAAAILKERRDTVYNTMLAMANVLWRASEDVSYTFSTSKVTIVKGRLYRGIPYTYGKGTLASFMEFAGEPNDKGEYTISGITSEMLDGSSRHARIGNSCSGAAVVAYGSIGASVRNDASSDITINNGFIPVGPYQPDPNTNSNDSAVCEANGEQVMFQSYAAAQYADIVVCSGHTMMTQKVNVVYKDDGTIDGDLSTMTVVHQNPDPIRNDRYFTSGPYSEANYGEKVYRTFLIDDDWTFNRLFAAGYMPYTCIELIDPSPIAAATVSDTETEHSYANILTGVISSNRFIDCVTMTITDENGETLQQATARTYRSDTNGPNRSLSYDLAQLRVENPMKMKGNLNLNLLGVGNYHCRLDVRLMSGETVEKVRDFDFAITEEDLCEGWVDNSDLEFTEGNKAVCPVCGGDPVEWTKLTAITSNKTLTTGHYYLAEDLNISARFSVSKSNTVCVHLNGHNITSSTVVFYLNTSLSLLNVMGNGTVKGSYTSEENNYGATMHFAAASGNATLYGGTYGHTLASAKPTVTMEASRPELTIYGGATFCRMENAQGTNIEIRAGVVNLRGGRILDGTNTTGSGGNVRVYSSETVTGWPSTFTMYSGIIAGGRAKYGGNVYIARESGHGSKPRTFAMEGGLLHFGLAGYAAGSDGYGGNIYASTGAVVNQTGGTITYGASYSGGGNLYVRNGAQVTIGGIVEKGNGDFGSDGQAGGNIYLLGAEGTVSQLTVTGTVRDPLKAAGSGGNIFCSYSDVIVDGGTISGGSATSRGGNIYLTNTSTSLTVKNGGKIIGGTAANGGNVGTNIAGTTITLEDGEISGGTATEYGPDLRLHAAATVNISGGKMGNVYGLTGKFSLSGTGSIEKLDMSTGTVKIDNGWTGTADVNWGGSYVTGGVLTKASCGTTTNGAYTAGGSYTGTLVYDGEARAFGKDGVISLGTAVKTAGATAWYPTVEEALAIADESSTVKLYADASITVEKELYLDINGNAVTASGTGTVYGIDSSNDDYATNGTLTASCTVEKDVADPATGNRYICLTTDGVSTFHRLNMRMTNVTLRSVDTGIYYKAQYDCDTVLAEEVKCYGAVLSINNMPGADFATEMWDINRYTVAKDPFAPGVIATSGSVFNVMKETHSNVTNVTNGERKIYANAYLMLEDGTMLMADKTTGDSAREPGFDGVAYSLYDVLQSIDDNWETFEDHHDMVLAFYNTWKDKGMSQWADKFENIS